MRIRETNCTEDTQRVCFLRKHRENTEALMILEILIYACLMFVLNLVTKNLFVLFFLLHKLN